MISENGSVTIFRWKEEKGNLCWWSRSKWTCWKITAKATDTKFHKNQEEFTQFHVDKCMNIMMLTEAFCIFLANISIYITHGIRVTQNTVKLTRCAWDGLCRRQCPSSGYATCSLRCRLLYAKKHNMIRTNKFGGWWGLKLEFQAPISNTIRFILQ